jgi:TetR/AcrR family transcriptional regulator
LDLRQRVVTAAEKSFSMFGYKGTTMDQVARIANVGKGTIYTFFDSKEALFISILNSLIDDLKRTAETAIDEERPFFDNLEQALRGILTYRQQHELFVKLIQEVREIGTGAVVDGLAYVEDAIVQFITRHLREGQRRGDVAPCNSEVVAFVMLRTYTSLVVEWEQRHAPLSDEEIRQTFHQLFANGLNRQV